jgi:hypothetical protein
MKAVVFRDMIDPITREPYRRAFVVELASLDQMPAFLDYLDKRYPREEPRNDKA